MSVRVSYGFTYYFSEQLEPSYLLKMETGYVSEYSYFSSELDRLKAQYNFIFPGLLIVPF
jgi:hypothetical protein